MFVTSNLTKDKDPVIGNFVGELTDELYNEYGPSSYIEEFCSGGPKNYALKIYVPSRKCYETIVKVKGIRLNYEISKIINFNTIREIILDHGPREIQTLIIIFCQKQSSRGFIQAFAKKISYLF
jgi:hypothetical protein